MSDWEAPEGWDSSEATAESYGDFDMGGFEGVDDATYTIDQYGEVYQEDDGSLVAPEGFELSGDEQEALESLMADGYASTSSMPEMPEFPEFEMPEFVPAAGGSMNQQLLVVGGVAIVAVLLVVGLQGAMD